MAEAAAVQDDFHREKAIQELKTNGYTVIPNVISAEECDQFISEYRTWLEKFGEAKPVSRHSLIQNYHIGHFDVTWRVRLKARPVFAQIWETNKLLTSCDAVAIGAPPESSGETFRGENPSWFHADQGGKRVGLHAYQGAINLEEATESDWCLRVMKGYNNHLEQFYEEHPKAKSKSSEFEFYRLKKPEFEWFVKRGCEETVVACPKGGLVLWDSRTIHDSVRPIKDRENQDRWRFVVFVCMGPAKWAKMADLQAKRNAYKTLSTTTHWPCENVRTFSENIPSGHVNLDVALTKLPNIARTDEVKELVGMKDYDFFDGESNGPPPPQWHP